MITMYKRVDAGLIQLDEPTIGCWINVVDPDPNEIKRLTSLGIPQDFITYPLDQDERARTEREDNGCVLILIRIPSFQGDKADIPYTTVPLGVVMTDQYVITVCKQESDLLKDFISGRKRELSTAKRNRFSLRVFLAIAGQYLLYLREINSKVELLEDQLQRSMKNKELLELLKYQKSLVMFTTALKSNELMMERLQRNQMFKLYPDDDDLLDDVLTENQQAIEMVNISSNILSSMMDAFASIISNNLNVVMKLLTSITIVMSIPTVVTSFFGMNVQLPFQAHPQAFMFVIIIFLLISAVVVFVFNKRELF